MFTGLVQALGTVSAVAEDGHGGQILSISVPSLATMLTPGESVAVNGACLTVVACDTGAFRFQAGPETLQRTNLGRLVAGDPVNFERALRIGDSLGGHFVTGHVDSVGTIAERRTSGEWETVWFTCPKEFDALMVEKGSIAVDGVSLTLVDVAPGQFSVMLIPHTLANTTLGRKSVGAVVNIECDLLAKHVQKLMLSKRVS
jgi:riboflavin synthase